jgi:hypothetical protein
MLDYRLTLVRATDNLGRNVPFENHGGGLNTTAEKLIIAADASAVDLVFGYEPLRLITFQVKPEIIELQNKTKAKLNKNSIRPIRPNVLFRPQIPLRSPSPLIFAFSHFHLVSRKRTSPFGNQIGGGPGRSIFYGADPRWPWLHRYRDLLSPTGKRRSAQRLPPEESVSAERLPWVNAIKTSPQP